MSERLVRLAARMRDELTELDRVADCVAEGWGRALRNGDDYYLDSVALNLHGFYGGLERIFELIAATIDNTKPKGENWHQALLQQMATEIPDLRPAVISQKTLQSLDEYRGFRHVVRNVYAYNFETAKLQKLVADLPADAAEGILPSTAPGQGPSTLRQAQGGAGSGQGWRRSAITAVNRSTLRLCSGQAWAARSRRVLPGRSRHFGVAQYRLRDCVSAAEGSASRN